MTSPHVQRHRKVEANRRRVTTRGKRVSRPRNVRPSRRMKRRTGATVGVLGLLTAICSFGGAVFTVAGAVTTAVGGVTVAWIEYRRDLIEVKRTGKPIGHQDPPKPEPKPERNLAHPPPDARKPQLPGPCRNCNGTGTITANLKGGRTQKFYCPACATSDNVGKPAGPPSGGKPTSKVWPPKGHNPKCRAKSAATCRCPKGRTGAKRKTS